MSQLSDVFTALAAKQITVDTQTPTIKDLGDLKNSITSADMPIRFLSEIEGGNLRLINVTETNSKAAYTIEWTIQDLLLWKPLGATDKIGSVMPNLASYAGKYAEMLREFQCPTTQTQLKQANIQVRPVEWPELSGSFYFGCISTLTILEYLTE